ncbi:MAG: ComEC/Rec2 family competence protein [Parvularculales bacterium]
MQLSTPENEEYKSKILPRLWLSISVAMWRIFGVFLIERVWGILEKEREQWFLWIPILMGVGISVYFLWPTEPTLVAYGVLVIVFLFCLPGLWAKPWVFLLSASVLAVSAGFLAAGHRAYQVQAPVLQASMKGVEVEGRIISLEYQENGKGARWILEPSYIETLPIDALPHRIRLRSHTMPEHFMPGDSIWARALLNPLPGPVEPGAYHYGRRLWFEQNGATGVTFGPPYPLRAQVKSDVMTAVHAIRVDITKRIQAVLDNPEGGIASALITGHREAIPKQAEQALRDSGLAHILAISGLHVAMVSGLLFWLMRWLLLRLPSVALRLPVRKWAAGAALAGALFYLVISGASIATQRASIMIAIMTIAVMLDRPALTMRNIAIAAILVLLVQPESLLEAGFQMSFAATMALIAVYEGRGDRIESWFSGKQAGLIKTGSRYAATLVLTSLIAGTATGLFAAYHFNRFAVYGLIANLLAVPLLGAIVMPLVLLSVALMPLGLEAYPLHGAGMAINSIVWFGREIASWLGAIHHMPSGAPWTLALLAIGGGWLCLWHYSWRWWGVLPIIVAVVLPLFEARPDILIDRQGRTVGLLHEGLRYSARPRRGTYAVGIWRKRDGSPLKPANLAQSSPWQCTDEECSAELADGRTVVLAETLISLDRQCQQADIVITPLSVETPCPSADLFIRGRDLESHGAHGIYLEKDGLHTQRLSRNTRQRPWGP